MNHKKYFLASISSYLLKYDNLDFEALIQTQLINESEIHKFYSVLKLEFNNGELCALTDIFKEYDEKEEIFVKPSIKKKYQINEVVPKSHMHMSSVSNGAFSLFGKKSSFFNLPNSGNYTINYFGKIKRELINWLPFQEIELFSPEFLKDTLYIDYNDKNNPKYINEEVIEKVNFPDKSKGYTIKEYKVKNFNPKKNLKTSDRTYGNLAIPDWLQDPEIPRCPNSNKVLKFMLQIDRHGEYYPQNKNDDFNYEPTIYIFFEPDSKVLAIILQTT